MKAVSLQECHDGVELRPLGSLLVADPDSWPPRYLVNGNSVHKLPTLAPHMHGILASRRLVKLGEQDDRTAEFADEQLSEWV